MIINNEIHTKSASYILSIVPPRDALTTAHRVSLALATLTAPRHSPLYYLDLNASSPSTTRSIASFFDSKTCHFVDGAIIGGPPSPRATPSADVKNVTAFEDDGHLWNRPSMPVSGPVRVSDNPIGGQELEEVLCMKHISNDIGPASGLKCCFATMTKGYTALAIQAFTTASSLGVLDELKSQLASKVPHMLKTAESGLCAMPPKAYRWVKEMEEIGACHADDGGFHGDGQGGLNIFSKVAGVYKEIAENEVLGAEKTGERKRGRTSEDVAELVGAGLKKKAKKYV